MNEYLNFENLLETEFVVVDIETTGFSSKKGAKIIEIGAVKYKNGEKIGEYNQLINPELKITKTIEELTGISNDHVKDKPLIYDVIGDFKKFIGTDLLIIHNAKFDWDRFLKPAFFNSGIIPINKVFDSLAFSKIIFPEEKKHNLKDLCDRLGIKVDNHHRALDDAIMTYQIYEELKKLYKNEITIATNLIQVEEEVFVESPVIRKASYWEKRNTKRLLYARIYVGVREKTDYINVYYDILKDCWINIDSKKNIDFKIIEDKVIKFLRLNNKEDLKKYK